MSIEVKPFIANFFISTTNEVSCLQEYDDVKQIGIREAEEFKNGTNTSTVSVPSNDDTDSDISAIIL